MPVILAGFILFLTPIYHHPQLLLSQTPSFTIPFLLWTVYSLDTIWSPLVLAHEVMNTRIFRDSVVPRRYLLYISSCIYLCPSPTTYNSYRYLTLRLLTILYHDIITLCEAAWEKDCQNLREPPKYISQVFSELPSMMETVCFASWSSPEAHLWCACVGAVVCVKLWMRVGVKWIKYNMSNQFINEMCF